MTSDAVFGPFSVPYAPPDEPIAARLLQDAGLDAGAEARIDRLGRRLIEAARGAKTARIGGLEDLLREYSLSTEEGVALMVLAEALLRVPDSLTADALIAEKIGAARWTAEGGHASEPLVVSAAAWALGATARMLDKGKTAEGVIALAAKRLGLGALRAAARQAMQLMGQHFVFADEIEEALRRASSRVGSRHLYSFDMLGEGARTKADADRYFESYANAIESVGRARGAGVSERLGVSVKLSALHPRFEPACRERVMRELTPRLIDLARLARRHDLQLTIDAEEADRLELSLDLIAAAMAAGALQDWSGFGLAVQAYQKRAGAVIDHVAELAARHRARMTLRLVKGAYWDAEIKRAQERGLADYPVFTRKAMTDLNYIACARRLLAARARIAPQFATHNALTVATIVTIAGGVDGYEFQRLHGMGEELYAGLRADYPQLACRIYAPVGQHENLLAYLVRRLLENGANSSFVAQIGDRDIPAAALLERPQKIIINAARARAAGLPPPREIHGPERKVAEGVEFGDRAQVERLLGSIRQTPEARQAELILAGGKSAPQRAGGRRQAISPIDGAAVGFVDDTDQDALVTMMQEAQAAFRTWSRRAVEDRAARLDRAAQRLEAEAPRWLRLLQLEGGKTLDDAVAEWREAIDFLRYYAALARKAFGAAPKLPGPTGEDNRLHCHGRGVFVCISPWNFPLAIFLGQVAAALVCGNAVIAKPAEQTPLIAAEAVALLHKAGVPAGALRLAQGDGKIGAALVALPGVAGVAFTGSVEAAASINRALAAKDGPIAPLIAETGGVNAMIVDATALPEQVADDVVASAFRSAGQRCSALRLLCLQEEVADKMITMIAGAARELRVGDPRDIGVQIGPVIDAEARAALLAHIEAMRAQTQNGVVAHFAGEVDKDAPANGFYVAPHIFELAAAGDLKREVFGPILHVVRYKAPELDLLLDAIEAKNFGLTLGVHSRIDSTIARILERRLAGNCYVNRNMIGAVVGTQPFGGFNLSGTGPKAGGPHYLQRFVVEQTVTINTAAVGGNVHLLNAID
ncbi:bifunctional proline dehydrogenase/L-glutamate gamma-semialdehyde dehydrogenase PutA [Methylocella silvestris]|uniref:Bifunctional protein PutA n=1 Tax=Methylocella silvestris TaxID=199596 RepID=A0A2J7TIE0_METSI|nr:bifunctional proline dehydrogenase/L-glutamate gamma-semialdehyde dehydrogenase PutA [Methylocella silvestris]PNG26543.1 bifunctional proline dehydrogenase/L-glutamate gamma-semialdehyde dehydrogenase [Methylocella silvestris]